MLPYFLSLILSKFKGSQTVVFCITITSLCGYIFVWYDRPITLFEITLFEAWAQIEKERHLRLSGAAPPVDGSV